jgi:hypothetical protein
VGQTTHRHPGVTLFAPERVIPPDIMCRLAPPESRRS